MKKTYNNIIQKYKNETEEINSIFKNVSITKIISSWQCNVRFRNQKFGYKF